MRHVSPSTSIGKAHINSAPRRVKIVSIPRAGEAALDPLDPSVEAALVPRLLATRPSTRSGQAVRRCPYRYLGLSRANPSIAALEECILPLMEPGAGLVGVDGYSDTDNLFDSIFCGPGPSQPSDEPMLAADIQQPSLQDALRLYTMNNDL